MRIFSIYYTHKPGGFCKRLYRLLNALSAAGHTVHYFALDNPPEALSKTVIFKQIPFALRSRSGVGFWFLFTLWAPLYFAWSARRLKPERIVVFGAYYGCISILARACTSSKLVLFIRSLVFEINKITEKPFILQVFSNVLERIGMRGTDRLIAMSNTMATELRSFIKQEREILLLPNDVPSRTATPIELPKEAQKIIQENASSEKVLILISGVFDARKNLQLVLDTFLLLGQNTPNHPFALLVAGEGQTLASAKEFVSRHSLTSVHFLGWLPSLDALYPAVMLIVHPSLHEGMPNSVLEAWGYGIPALLAATPELREIAPHDELWIEPLTPQSLYAKLSALGSKPDSLEKLKTLTNKCTEPLRFDWDGRAVSLVTEA